MDIKIIKDWKQVTLQQFVAMVEIQGNETDPTKAMEKVTMYLYGIDPMKMPYTDYLAIIRGLNSLFEKPLSEQKITKNGEYILNGTAYVLNINPAAFTTAQYIDFTNFAKNGRIGYVDMLSAVLIPAGHIYNDGYDMDKTKTDIGSMPADLALGIVNFFLKWSKASIATILRFLTSRKRMKKVNKEKQKALRAEIKRLCQLLESSHLS